MRFLYLYPFGGWEGLYGLPGEFFGVCGVVLVVSVLGGYLRDSCCALLGWGSYGGVSVMVRMGWWCSSWVMSGC